jgi:poly-gamma-glutamate synthesis protein (capsule biosynthesis protein)
MKTRTLLVLSATAIAMMDSATPAGAQEQGSTTWSLAALGDAMINRRIMPFDQAGDPQFQGMARIIRGTDVAMANLEMSLFRMSEFNGWPHFPTAQIMGNWQVGPPEGAVDLKHLGLDFLNRANHHATDYGIEGVRMTSRLLDENGLVHAGSGMNLAEASRPGYVDTPKGRIAFIGLATTFAPWSRAGAARPDMRGRPGLNALRVDTTYEADAATFDMLRTASAAGLGDGARSTGEVVRVLGRAVRRGDRNRMIATVNASDQARILREIRNASKQANFVVVTSHSHESTAVPPAWFSEFIKKCLDAGAVAYVASGPHAVRGVEVYRGKPIFYGLGMFIMHNFTNDRMPAEMYEYYGLPDTALASDVYDARFPVEPSREEFESVIAVPTFRGSALVDLRLYPLDLGHQAPWAQRGTPRLAGEEIGRRIIDRIAKMSAPLGTTITYQNGIGVWRAGTAQAGSR